MALMPILEAERSYFYRTVSPNRDKMKAGIIIAMSSEYNEMLKLLGGKAEGEIAGNRIILRESGIGKVNAAIKAVEMIKQEQPDCIISTGVAGGAGKGVRIMDIVVGREIVYHDVWCGDGNEYGQVQGLPARFRSDDTLYNIAMSIKGESSIHGGLICSGDYFVGPEQLEAIRKRFPEGLAVEMESGALAQVCHIYGIPFLSFRVISDSPEEEGNYSQYIDFWSTVAETSFKNIRCFLEALPKSL